MLRERDGGCQGRVVGCNMPSMRKRSLWVRTPLLLLTLLQFSVPAAAAWADARIGEPAGPAHIESHSTAGCARIHPADCAFHRFLSAPLARNAATVVRIREGRGISRALALSIMLAGGAVSAAAASDPPSISGRVTDAGGQPVDQVTVRVIELRREARTGSDGRFTIAQIL